MATLTVSSTLDVTGNTTLSTLTVSGAHRHWPALRCPAPPPWAATSRHRQVARSDHGCHRVTALALTVTCTFLTPTAAVPASVIVTPSQNIAPAVRYYVSGVTTAGFTVTFDVAPLLPQQFYYVVIQ